MTPAKLAHHHLREAEKVGRAMPPAHAWLKATRDRQRRDHLQAALLVIWKCSGGSVRAEAKELLRGLG